MNDYLFWVKSAWIDMRTNTLIQKIDDSTALICVVGLGYVGLPTAINIASKGFKVVGIDIDNKKIETLNKGISPIKDEFVQNNLKSVLHDGRITF